MSDKQTEKTIQLDTPIKRGKTEITEIVLRKPQSGALRGTRLQAIMDTWWVRMKTCWYLIALMPTGATLNGQRKCSGNACNAALRHSRYNWRKGGQISTQKCL